MFLKVADYVNIFNCEGCLNGRGITMIYFDNSATTKSFPEVVESFIKVSTEFYGNPSSLHRFGGQAEHLLNQARGQIARLLSIKENEIIFTSGGTEGNNLAIKGVAEAYKNRGRHIITTSVEHASVKEPFKHLENNGFDVTILPVGLDGRVKVTDLEKEIRKDTILISVMHVNNEVGVIQPIKEIGQLLKRYPKTLFHVDHVQGMGKIPLDLHGCHIDLCTISGHKFHGFKGTGLLFIKEGVTINPLFHGGNQERKWRSGTENVAGAVSLAKSLRLIKEKLDNHSNQIETLSRELRKGLESIKGVIINTPTTNVAPHIINISIPQMKSEVIVHALEEKDIYVSTTSACSSKQNKSSSTLSAMGYSKARANSAIRLSMSYTNTLEEVRKVLLAIEETTEALRKVMK